MAGILTREDVLSNLDLYRAWKAAACEEIAVKAKVAAERAKAAAQRQPKTHKREARYQPLYVINYGALRDHSDPIGIIDHLVDCLANPRWRREPLCRECENFKVSKKAAKDVDKFLDEIPRRPGAPAPTESCSGCWYAYLDDLRQAERVAKRKTQKSHPIRRKRRKGKNVSRPKKKKTPAPASVQRPHPPGGRRPGRAS